MGYTEASRSAKIGLGISAVAAVLVITGLATTYWIEVSTGQQRDRDATKIYFGLFKYCVDWKNDLNCVSIPEISPDWFKATKAMAILGAMFGVGCSLALAVLVFYRNEDLKIKQWSMVLSGAAGVFTLIGVIIFGANSLNTIGGYISGANSLGGNGGYISGANSLGGNGGYISGANSVGGNGGYNSGANSVGGNGGYNSGANSADVRDVNLGCSFILAVVGGVIHLVAAAGLLYEYRNSQNSDAPVAKAV